MSPAKPTSDDLIAKLAADAKPVRPASAGMRALTWYFLSVAGVSAAALVTLGARDDLRAPGFLLSVLSLLAAAGFAADLALRTGVPGAAVPRARFAGLVVSRVLFLIACSLGALGMAREGTLSQGIFCAISICVLSVLPGLALLYTLRGLAPIAPSRTGFFLGIAMASVGALGVTLFCPSDEVFHLLPFHALPIYLLGELARRLSARALRW